MTVLWTGVAVNFCFPAFRDYVRLKVLIFLDDILVLMARLISLVDVILYQVMMPTVYLISEVYEAVDTGGLAAPRIYVQNLTCFSMPIW